MRSASADDEPRAGPPTSGAAASFAARRGRATCVAHAQRCPFLPPRRRPLVRRLMLRRFPLLCGARPAISTARCRLRRRERRGQDQPARGAVAVLAGPRPAARRTRRLRARSAAPAASRVAIELEEDGEARPIGVGVEPGAKRRERAQPHRPGARRLRARLRRPSAARLADAGDGRAVRRPGAASGGASSIGSCWRSTPQHGARVNQFERALRGRNRLLEEGARNAAWLDALEREAAELGVASPRRGSNASRGSAARSSPSATTTSPFPWAELALRRRGRGAGRGNARRSPPRTATARALRDNRGPRRGGGAHADRPACRRSRRSGTARRTRPRRTPRPASRRRCWSASCSRTPASSPTCRASRPIALLDEIAAHFDPRRRAALFDALERHRRAGLRHRRRSRRLSRRLRASALRGGRRAARRGRLAPQAWPASADSMRRARRRAAASARSYLAAKSASNMQRRRRPGR